MVKKSIKHKEQALADQRFGKIYSDPRFRTLARKERKIQLDDRFKAMFTDAEFQVPVPLKVDERGVQVEKIQNPLAHVYDTQNIECIDQEGNFKWNVPSSSESASEAEEAIAELEEVQAIPTGEAYRRIAVMNCDWNIIKALDLLAIFKSFNPGVLKVSIYPSEFGKARMEKEAASGPALLNSVDLDEDALRKYELEVLKYYYAVIECDSIETACKVYEECDGLEIERTSNVIDMRFITDSVEFPYQPIDVAGELPKNYKMLEFYTKALQHSRVTLSWDENPTERTYTLRKAFAVDDLDDEELHKFIATPSPERDVSEEIEEKAEKNFKNMSQFNKLRPDGVDLEIKFHSGFDEIGENLLKDDANMTVWERHVAKKETKKKKAREERKKERKEKKHNKIDKKSLENLQMLVDSKGDVSEFKMNPDDSRFSKLYTDPSYGIDPTSTRFRVDADGNKVLLNYQIKKRQR